MSPHRFGNINRRARFRRQPPETTTDKVRISEAIDKGRLEPLAKPPWRRRDIEASAEAVRDRVPSFERHGTIVTLTASGSTCGHPSLTNLRRQTTLAPDRVRPGQRHAKVPQEDTVPIRFVADLGVVRAPHCTNLDTSTQIGEAL